MESKRKEKGFTLVEMIIVIAIIGILATLLVPSIMHFVKKARLTAAIGDAKVIKSAVESSLIDRLTQADGDLTNAFNKILYLDKNKKQIESVGAFTSFSWYNYRKKINQSNKSAKVDKVIAGALEGEFSEQWDTGAQVNPLKYNNAFMNCGKYLMENNTNFALVLVYNRSGSVRMMQIYRKGILVTYVNGEFIGNMDTNSHFVGSASWGTIYTDVGREAPDVVKDYSLKNGQIRDDGSSGNWY